MRWKRFVDDWLLPVLMLVAIFGIILAISMASHAQTAFTCRPPRGSGPTVACLGDSNTQPAPGDIPWCNRPILTDGFRTENCGWAGATATTPNPQFNLPHLAGLNQLAESDSDVVVIAFGTNDLGFGLTAQQTVDAILLIYNDAIGLGMQPYAATVPPNISSSGILVPVVNAALMQAIPTAFLIDFHTDMQQYLSDGVHFTDAGQQLRAERVALTLSPPIQLETKAVLVALTLLFVGRASIRG